MKQIPKQMTKTQERFFNKPRTMDEIITLFRGDNWAANHFQNDMLNSKQLETVLINNKILLQRPK